MGSYILGEAAKTAPPPANQLDQVRWQQQWFHQKGPESQPPNCGPGDLSGHHFMWAAGRPSQGHPHSSFIDCACGKQLSLAVPPVPPQTPSPKPGLSSFQEDLHLVLSAQPAPSDSGDLPGWGLSYPGQGTLPPCCSGTVGPASSPGSPLRSQEALEAKGSPLKTLPARCSARGTVTGSLRAVSSCVCGQAG